MKSNDLLVSNLNISEDEYSYKGLFTLSGEGISMAVDLSELDENITINEIINKFTLKESKEEIRKIIMDKVMVQAAVSTQIKEGIDFQDEKKKNKIDKSANSLDMA
jgi:fructose-1-phosphate kinase PfkB-like protein